MNRLIVFDNTVVPNDIIKEVIGNKGFGDVVVKRKLLKTFFQQNINAIYSSFEWMEFNSLYDVESFVNDSDKFSRWKDLHILHCFADYIISDNSLVGLTYKKLDFIEETIALYSGNKICGLMFCALDRYVQFLQSAYEIQGTRKTAEQLRIPEIKVDGNIYIGEISNFIQCITGNFDSRYFNSLEGNEYCLRKSSNNKKKIKSEFTYYHLLPDDMKRWFVLPFDYQEDDEKASYIMERLHMTDIAIKWVHGSVDITEFSELMDMYFYFFKCRSKKQINEVEYKKIAYQLYIEKVKDRIEELKKMPEYKKIENLLLNNDELKSIDDIFEFYTNVKERVESRVCYQSISVIGHGDPCFSNAMYNHSTRTLKFIDPKGALCEEELWTNPYYDIAKLSHSVCGRYDFFNNAMFDITIDEEFKYILTIPFENDKYKEVFRIKVEENGYDYWSVRLYEASLFLSMLPLHIDYPHKVFGFILNAVNILKEINENV